MSKEEILRQLIKVGNTDFQSEVYEYDGAGGSMCYVREDIAFKAMTEYTSQEVQAFKEKLTLALVNKGFNNDDYNGKILFDLIDKL